MPTPSAGASSSPGRRAGLDHQLFDDLTDGRREDPVGSRRVRVAGCGSVSSVSVLVRRQRCCGADLADHSARRVESDSEHLRPTDVDPERQARRASTGGRGRNPVLGPHLRW